MKIIYPTLTWQKPKNIVNDIKELLLNGEKSNFSLTGRDLDILEVLWKYRFLQTKQIAALLFANTKKPEKHSAQRLYKLFNVQLVKRYRPWAPPGEGTRQFIYALSPLGWNLLYQKRVRDNPDLEIITPWKEEDDALELSRVIHELELNEFCIALEQVAERMGLYFEWVPTRAAVQIVSPGQTQKSFRIRPDALIWIGEQVLHVEYERYSNRRKFQEKLQMWKKYRALGAWKKVSPLEPIILIVGNKENGPVEGKSRKIRSIVPLMEMAAGEGMANIWFMYNRDWQNDCWMVRNVWKEEQELLTLVTEKDRAMK